MSHKPNTISPSLSNEPPYWPIRFNRSVLYGSVYEGEIPSKRVNIGIRTVDLAHEGLQDLDPRFGEYLWQHMRDQCLESWALTDHVEGEMQEQGAK